MVFGTSAQLQLSFWKRKLESYKTFTSPSSMSSGAHGQRKGTPGWSIGTFSSLGGVSLLHEQSGVEGTSSIFNLYSLGVSDFLYQLKNPLRFDCFSLVSLPFSRLFSRVLFSVFLKQRKPLDLVDPGAFSLGFGSSLGTVSFLFK